MANYTQVVDVSIPINVNTSAGPLVDGSLVTSAMGVPRYRQRCNISDPSDPMGHAAVTINDTPADAYGIVARDPQTSELLAVLRDIAQNIRLLRAVLTDTDEPTIETFDIEDI